MPPAGYTNTDYFGWIVDAAQTANSNIKITVTLNAWDIDVLNRIFHDPTNPDATSAQSFASNVVAFLDHYQINGIDVDWETCFDQTTGCQDCIGSYYSNPSSDPQCPGTHGTSADMFVTVFTAIGSAFDTAEANDDSADYLLTLSPAMPGTFNNACGKTVSCYFDAVNLQLRPGAFIQLESPVVTFVLTDQYYLVAAVNQHAARFVNAGDDAEVALTMYPVRLKLTAPDPRYPLEFGAIHVGQPLS